LFNLVESMQRRLEAEGLDNTVIDIAVTRGLQTLLGPAHRGAEHLSRNLLLSTLAHPAQG
jgi:hypothetical protein